MNKQFRVSRRGLVVALGLAQVPFAYAQDVSTQARAALEEIIVTAERRETQLQDTPISIASLTSEQIERTGSQQLEDLQAFVPNMVINYDPFFGRANPQFNIRGVGASTVTSGVVTERPVGLYIDGLYYARVQGSLLSMMDVGQIDVLRGPQGTLFGRNATGGAIVYTSKKPTDEFEGHIGVKAGKFDQREVQGMMNLPLGENVFLKVLAAQVEQDGYVQRAYEDLGNVDDEVYRTQLRILPADNLTIDLSGSYSETRSNGSPLVINEYNLNGRPNGGSFGAVNLLLEDQGEPAFVSNDPRIVSRDQAPAFCILDDTNPLTFGEECETNLEGELSVFSANVKWDISDTVSLTSITGRLSGNQISDSDWANTGASTRSTEIDFETTSQEFQLTWNADALKFVAGAIYFNEKAVEDEIYENITISGFSSFLHLTPEQVRAGESVVWRDQTYEADTTSYGIYMQATWSVTDRLNLTGGLRYSKDEKDVLIVRRTTEDEGAPGIRTGRGSETWDDVDWRAAVDYRVTDDVMVYASATNAYKAGIADDSALENSLNTENVIPFVPPEHATGYEVGLRSEWFDRRFRYNMSVFRTDYTNRQSAQLVSSADGSLTLLTVNLGDVRYQGFEIDTALALPYNVTLNGSFGLVDYEVSDDPDGVLANIPEESWTAGIAWAPPVSSGQLEVSANYGYSGPTWAFSGGTDLSDSRIPVQARNPGYGVLSGRISYEPDSQGWSVALYGTNLLDKDYTGSSVGHHFHLGSFGRTARAGYLGRPRSFGVEAQLNF